MVTGRYEVKMMQALTQLDVRHGQRLLVGVSGGADSVALVELLVTLKRYTIAVAHLHHGIRGLDADRDADFVRKLAGQNGLRYYERRADIPRLAEENGKTVEEAARDARYAFFEQTLTEWEGDYIVTAHHMDDQAETVLMHLLRGSGIAGLAAMQEKRGRLIRPLLSFAREEIMAYVKEKGLQYRTDATNQDIAYTRNRIRHLLMPLLKEQFNPGIVQALQGLADSARQDDEYIRATAQDAMAQAEKDRGRYDAARLQALHPAIKNRVLLQILREKEAPVSRKAVQRLSALLQAETGACVSLGADLEAYRSYGDLSFRKRAEGQDEAIAAPFLYPGETKTPRGSFLAEWTCCFSKMDGPHTAYLDADMLPKDCMVRPRRTGDLFHPLGASGAKKLKDYLIDKKIPREKRGIPGLFSGSRALFFPGGTISDILRVTEGTKRILRVIYKYE